MSLTQEQTDNFLKILNTPGAVKPPGPFIYGQTSWNKWKKKYLRLLQSSGCSLTDQEKIYLLLSLMGEWGEELHYQLSRTGELFQQPFSEFVTLLDAHFRMMQSAIYRRFHFNQRDQLQGECINKYVSALKKLADVCEYGHLRDEMIRDKLIAGILSETARRDLLDCDHLTLEMAIQIVHFHELKSTRRYGC